MPDILSKFKPLAPLSEAFLRLIYPAFCALCRRALPLEEALICGACAGKIKRLELPLSEARKLFQKGPLKEYFALYAYKEGIRDLWTQVKFARRSWLLQAFGPPLEKFLLAVQPETRYDYLIPVPTTLWRRLKRHYNQADILAKEISRLSGVPVVKALKKVRLTRSQRQLSREERRHNLRGSLAVRFPGQVRGRSVLVIDDIFTTGATACECARVLKQAGCVNVGIFALAQTPVHKNP